MADVIAPDDEGEGAEQQQEAVDSFFAEADEVVRLISCFSDPEGAHEQAAERVASILDRYQEQPSILDPQLEAMVTPLLESVRLVARHSASPVVLPHACRVMYTLCKVRGYKTIVKFVPHEVADLEPLVHLLAGVDPGDHSRWQVRAPAHLPLSPGSHQSLGSPLMPRAQMPRHSCHERKCSVDLGAGGVRPHGLALNGGHGALRSVHNRLVGATPSSTGLRH